MKYGLFVLILFFSNISIGNNLSNKILAVVNNNIILIDTFDFLKNKTDTVKEAIIKTGAQRLRPVLLTTTTTVLGLLPMVTMTNIDFVTSSILFWLPLSLPCSNLYSCLFIR